MEKITSTYFLSKARLQFHVIPQAFYKSRGLKLVFEWILKHSLLFRDVITDTSGHQLINIISLNWIITQITAIMETYYAL